MNSVISRAQWGAMPPKTTPEKVPIASRTASCTHHDGATPITIHSLSEACLHMRAIQKQHMMANGWNDIGYNFLVVSAPGYPVDGLIMEGRGRDVVGAHCKDWNTPWVGIQVMIGGAQVPSPAALFSVRALHGALVKGAGHPLVMKGHRDGFATACPGPVLTRWLAAGMPVGTKIAAKVVAKTVVNAVAKAPAKLVAKATGRLVADGNFGPATIKALQRWLWVKADGLAGITTWRALQTRLGISVDGMIGPKTWRAVQAMVGARADGIPGPATIKALQRFLNNR